MYSWLPYIIQLDLWSMCAGVGMLVRKMGASFKPSQLISCDGDKWTIKTVTSFKTTEISFTPGVEFDETTADGRNMKVCRSFGWMIFPLECFFGIEVHVALDWNPGPGYNILLLRLIPGDILSTYSHRQFHTPPGLLDSQTLINILTHACQAGRQFVPFLWWSLVWPDRARTRDLPHGRRTCRSFENRTPVTPK